MKKKCEALAAKLNVTIRVYKFTDWSGWEYDIELLDNNSCYEDQTTGRSGGGTRQYEFKSQAWEDIWKDLQVCAQMQIIKNEN